MAATKNDAADDTAKTASKPVFDVAKPGKTPASATSRPIIVTHKSMARDPMVAGSTPPEESEAEETSPSQRISATGKKIQPSADSELIKNESETPEEPEVTQDAPQDEEVQAQKKSMEEAAVDAFAQQAVKNKKKPDKEDEAKLAEIQKHIDEKTYFVPIGQVSKRRFRRRIMTACILLVLAAALYLGVDSELLPLDITLPVELIE